MNTQTQTPVTLKEAFAILPHFVSKVQLGVMKQLMKGVEGQFFRQKMIELATTIKHMPKTYEQEDKGDNAIVYLHYFGRGDWFITEKDMEAEQLQAFGLADLFGDGGELGYISIQDIINNRIEIDLHWTPKTLGEVRAKRNASFNVASSRLIPQSSFTEPRIVVSCLKGHEDEESKA